MIPVRMDGGFREGSTLEPLVDRERFGPLRRSFDGRRLSYLDSAATCLSPDCVVDAGSFHEKASRSNVHRGIHVLAEESTDAYERARETVACFIGADAAHLAFTRGATDSINIAAASLADAVIGKGDAIAVMQDAHHANIVPWQMAARRKGARIVPVELDDAGRVDESSWSRALDAAPRIVALAFSGNVLGIEDDTARRCAQAHAAGAFVVLDCAQRVGHASLDVSAIDADAVAFSAHKMYGPMGIGALWCSDAFLSVAVPPMGGGGSILSVTLDGFSALPFPHGFEPGTPSVAAAVSFAEAVRFLEDIGMSAVEEHDAALADYACRRLLSTGVVDVLGPADVGRRGIVSFSIHGVHPHDAAQVLSDAAVAVRAGHHCAMPLHRRFGVPASVRASFGVYNGADDVDRLCEAVVDAASLYA